MKAILVVLLLAVTASCQVNTNWIACGQAVLHMVGDVNTLVQDISQGKPLSDIIAQLQTLLGDIQDVQNKCGISDLTNIENVPMCVKDLLQVATYVVDVVQDVEKKDINAVINDLKAIIDEIPDIKANCLKDIYGMLFNFKLTQEQVSRNWIACVKDAVGLVKEVKQLVDDITAKKGIDVIIGDLNTLVGEIQKTFKDCGLGEFTNLPALNNFMQGDKNQCWDDINAIAATAQKISQDVASFDIKALAADIHTLYNQVQQAIQDCTQ